MAKAVYLILAIAFVSSLAIACVYELVKAVRETKRMNLATRWTER